DIASVLNIKQPSVSQIERQTDMYLSTLRSYVEAVGGELELTVRFQPMEKGSFFNLIRIRTNDARTPYILLKTEAVVE
ncbi:MAG TPA: XRE family transcriptional regulator, partial [Candidatus Aminicenantes bacterium]|nr:XRE family transcriptional regulator [Candidatus Aminicenantes bacterium]